MGANYNVERMAGGENRSMKPGEVSLGLEVCDSHSDQYFGESWYLQSLKVTHNRTTSL